MIIYSELVAPAIDQTGKFPATFQHETNVQLYWYLGVNQ